MEPRIENFEGIKLVGLQMSLFENKTVELWRSFMPVKNEIKNVLGNNLYSIQIYNENYFANFDFKNNFTKMAAVAVSSEKLNENKFINFEIVAGLYAVFIYKGKPQKATSFFENIYTKWLPNSIYQLDHRPHFEILNEKYKNDSDDSEEEVWIPLIEKNKILYK
jgi:AraC family transcriptional regulator